jgi:hypothetical protein
MVPQKSASVIGAQQYQCALKEAKNKGQMLRVALRTLSSMGYHSGADEKLWAKIEPYLDDFDD